MDEETTKHYLEDGDKIATSYCTLRYDEPNNTFDYESWEDEAFGPNGYPLQWDEEQQKYYEEF